MQIILKTKPEERRRLVRALEQFGRDNQVPAPALQAVDLALEEHLTNVIDHGYEDDAAHEIVIRFVSEEDCLQVEVEDDGKPFNPLDAPRVHTSVPLEEKPMGGLGVHLMRQFMDELSYRRAAGKNILRMTKRLNRSA